MLELQRLAGNAAVAKSLVGSKRDGRVVAGVDTVQLKEVPSAPDKGLKTIRALKNGAGILGYTVREVNDNPPILKPESPTKTEKGWTTKALPIGNVGEPKFTEYWPTQGVHKLDEYNHVKIDHDWETRLHKGEDEHVSDATLAWELTWKLVEGIVAKLAKEPGPPQPSEDAARKNLFDRYRKALPEPDLVPEGAQPDEDAQRKVLGVADGTLFWWMFQTTVVRDTRSYHKPGMASEFEGKTTIAHPEPEGDFQIPGPKSPELLAQVRKKFKPGQIIKGTDPIKR